MGSTEEMRATVVGFAGLVASASAFAPTSVLPKAATRTNSVAANAQMAVKSGINGFGRIGRQVARIMVESDDAELIQVNAGSATPDYMAYQYKFDSIHGRVGHEVVVEGDDMILKGKRVKTTREREPANIGWNKNGVEYLCESTGVFLTEEKAKAHVDAGVKKVIFSAPAKDDSLTVVMGVNQEDYKGQTDYVSCASCTTNPCPPRQVHRRQARHRGGSDDHHPRHDRHPGRRRLLVPQGLAWWPCRLGQHHPLVHRCRQGRGQGDPAGQGQADWHGLPRAHHRRVGCGPYLPPEDRRHVRGDLRRGQAPLRGRHEGLPRLHRRGRGVQRLRVMAHLLHLRCRGRYLPQPQLRQAGCLYDNEWGYSCRVKDLMVHMAN